MEGYSVCVGGVTVRVDPPGDGAVGEGKRLTPQQWMQLAAVIVQAILAFLGGGHSEEPVPDAKLT